jgi:hypothetical protein
MKGSVGVAAVGSMGSDMPHILPHEMFSYERKSIGFEATLADLPIDR